MSRSDLWKLLPSSRIFLRAGCPADRSGRWLRRLAMGFTRLNSRMTTAALTQHLPCAKIKLWCYVISRFRPRKMWPLILLLRHAQFLGNFAFELIELA